MSMPLALHVGPSLCPVLGSNKAERQVNSRLADTSLLRTPRYYGQQLNPRRKLQTFYFDCTWNLRFPRGTLTVCPRVHHTSLKRSNRNSADLSESPVRSLPTWPLK
ncbi:hypothetical protein OS493_000667 [Desmophyllum pertusum]|uniref:Uncharacterized protein n=1 Tax=Desmophyllum pertusum TaxID=174260 RepID=A0A9X0A7L8_9CNID|nr:hypothetical protein OS493_000667 [Desmophyllum pertusum]